MEISLNRGVNFKDIYSAMNDYRKTNTEKLIFEIINKVSENQNIRYIGDLNKNDLMF